MSVEAYVQAVLSAGLGIQVWMQAPKTIPDPFVLHTVTSATPVTNGGMTDAVDSTVAVSVVSKSNATARDTAWQVAEALAEAYRADEQAAGMSPALCEAQMLPVLQPSTDVASAPRRYQYDAIYRLIFAV